MPILYDCCRNAVKTLYHDEDQLAYVRVMETFRVQHVAKNEIDFGSVPL